MISKIHARSSAKLLSLILIGMAVSMIAVDPAHAAGWGAAADKVGTFASAAKTAMIALCGLGGIGAIAYGGKLLLKKAGDRGDDVEWSKIGYAVLGGAFLLSIAFVASSTVETLGGTPITL